jgi:hypothetical protein
MTDQHPGYREDWDITSEAGSLCFASAIYSRLVGGEQDEATFQWLAKYLRANAAPHHISAMTDQHQHRATPEQWAKVKGYAPGLEVCSCLIELRDRIQLLEATQHAHIEAKASEAGARCAVEQLRSKPGSWQPIKTETTYGSDAAIPELSEHRAPDEWLLHSYKVGPAEPVEDWGKGFTQVRTPDPAAGAQVGRSSPAVDRVLALQDQIRDGSLTLAKALKKINGDDQPVQQFIAKYVFTAGDIQQDSFCYDPSDSNSVSFDIAKFEPVNGCLKPGDNIKIAHRLGEVPASGVYSTINYKVVSVSETENRAWTIRAVRVDTSDSEPAPTADDQLTLVDRVANALYSVPEPAGGVRSLAAYSVALPAAEARAAIREVAEWLRSEYPLLTLGTAAWANLLAEANR